MTALEACDKIQEAIDGLHEETRTSGWDWSFTKAQSDEAHNADNRETLAKTRKHFKLEVDTSTWFVSANGTDAILAICGNSPTAEARARYISWVNPQNIQLMIARIATLEAELTWERNTVKGLTTEPPTPLTWSLLAKDDPQYGRSLTGEVLGVCLGTDGRREYLCMNKALDPQRYYVMDSL